MWSREISNVKVEEGGSRGLVILVPSECCSPVPVYPRVISEDSPPGPLSLPGHRGDLLMVTTDEAKGAHR